MSRPTRWTVVAAALALAALAPGWAERAASSPAAVAAGLEPLPRPNLDHLEEEVEAQLLAARAGLDEALASEEIEAARLATAFGEVGRLYFLYDLPDLSAICFTNARELDPDDFRWHYFLGAIHGLEGDQEAAEASLERALELEPNDLPALLRLGDLLVRERREGEARELFARVREIDPDNASALFGLARLDLEAGETERAVAGFERVLELQPEADAVHHHLGMAYRALGDLERARHHLALNRGTQVRFEDPLVERLGGLIRSAQVHFTSGIQALRASEFERAIRHFGEAAREDPEDPLIPYNLGLAHLRQGRRELAYDHLRQSIDLDPNFRNGHFNLGLMLAEEGRFEEAAFHFERAHEIDPEDRRTRLEWATALSRIGRDERALAELSALLETEPGDPEARLRRGIAFAGLARRQEAVGDLQRVLELDSSPAQLAEANAQLGALFEGARDPAALDHYRRAVELEPDAVARHQALAQALGRAGRFEEASGAFAAAIALAPDSLALRFGRTMAQLFADDTAGARSTLEEGLTAPPEDLPLRHLLARLLATSPDPAVRDGARALALAQQVMRVAVEPEHAETLAMALAENGRFDEAAGLQRRLIQELERRGETERIETARLRLESYERGEPVRSPWRRPG